MHGVTKTAEERQALADRLMLLRTDRGWTQTELARRAKLRVETVHKTEAARSNPTIPTLTLLASALGVTVEELRWVELATEGNNEA